MEALRSIVLDKEMPAPLYCQLKKQMLGLIRSSVLKTGDMLPTETELCGILGVSRPTIRQAFSELVADGYLYRCKGRGTFVAQPATGGRFLSRLESFTGDLLAKGLFPRTQVLGLEKTTRAANACEQLGLAPGTALIHLVRLRYADEVPVVLVETYLPHEPYRTLLNVDFANQSLYDSLESKYSLRVHRVHCEIEAVGADRSVAEHLCVGENTALNLVRTVAYAMDSEVPVEYSIARYRGDFNRFHIDVYR